MAVRHGRGRVHHRRAQTLAAPKVGRLIIYLLGARLARSGVSDRGKTMIQAFQDRILNDFLPTFCTSRSWSSDGFKSDWSKVSEVDATDFLRGFSGGLMKHEGRGLYRAPRSYASEHFFGTVPQKEAQDP
jgi:hypothetical protein